MDTIESLREKLSLAHEIIRQLTSSIDGPVMFRGIAGTKTDRVIMERLLAAKEPLSRERIRLCLDQVRGCTEASSMMSIDVAVHRLRKKLRELDPPVLIRCIRDKGFMLDAESRKRLAERRIIQENYT